MSTENENWRDDSSSEENSGNRFERENNYSRPSYNREGGDRPYRPRFNSESGERPQRAYSSDRPYRPRFNPNAEGGERPQRSYGDRPSYNREGGDRPQRSYGDRPSYNREGGDRPQRPFYGNNSGGDRPYRPRYNSGDGGDRPQRPSYGGSSYGDRPQRPRFNSGDGQRSYNNDRPYRPRYNSGDGGDRPQRSYGGSSYGGSSYGDRPQRPRFNPDGGRGGYGRPQQRRTPDYDPNAKYSRKKQIEYKEQFTDPNEPIRLNKFLANAGVCSRREADEFIQKGAVKVNDVVVTELGTKITRQDVVTFNEKPVQIESKVYIVLNKPKNCVTTSDDPQERLTVMDLVKNACQERIYPVGRLDRNTTGVLLLTNDGDLASKLTHPSFKKKKIYHVWLDKNVAIEDMEKIANGLELEDGEIHADAISYASEDDKSQVGIEIHSGRNRIVRRIFESLGYHVTKLDRVYFAGLTKKNLGRGKWRYLNEREVNALRMGAFE